MRIWDFQRILFWDSNKNPFLQFWNLSNTNGSKTLHHYFIGEVIFLRFLDNNIRNKHLIRFCQDKKKDKIPGKQLLCMWTVINNFHLLLINHFQSDIHSRKFLFVFSSGGKGTKFVTRWSRSFTQKMLLSVG